MHIENSQYYGVIGWLANDRKIFVKGEDTWQREGELKKMNPYSTHSHCTNCFKKYHHELMIQTKNAVDHYCLKCFNLKENENEKEKNKHKHTTIK